MKSIQKSYQKELKDRKYLLPFKLKAMLIIGKGKHSVDKEFQCLAEREKKTC